MIIGITGSIGVGKSTVFELLKKLEKKELANFVDTDEITKKLYTKSDVKKVLKGMFGTDVKEEISKIVFSNVEKRLELNKYMHSLIILEMLKAIQSNDKKFLYIDTPLLYELKLEHMFDKVVVVYANREKQIERIMKRNGYNKDRVLSMIDSQIDIEEKKKKADYVIDNSGDEFDLQFNVIDAIVKIKGDNKNAGN